MSYKQIFQDAGFQGRMLVFRAIWDAGFQGNLRCWFSGPGIWWSWVKLLCSVFSKAFRKASCCTHPLPLYLEPTKNLLKNFKPWFVWYTLGSREKLVSVWSPGDATYMLKLCFCHISETNIAKETWHKYCFVLADDYIAGSDSYALGHIFCLFVISLPQVQKGLSTT